MAMFENRKLLVATKHQKEKVIAPIVESALGVRCFVAENFDTDLLGTFSGEIDRKDDPITTLRNKCLMAMELNHCDLAIASEGSFGPHPSLFFMSADDELLIFIDKLNNIEIIARELSEDTNFNGRTVVNEKELLDFADSVKFPSHGLILRKSKQANTDIIKGLNDINDLKTAFNHLLVKHKTVYVETDMRAMYNPTRMKIIEKTTHRLINKINSLCPQCSKPGFDVTSVTRGLKCSCCGSPTNSILSYVYICQHCHYKKETLHPHNKTMADPKYCDFCNP